MRSKVKFSIITSVALISIASFVIFISCGGLGDLIPDIVLDTIWDVLGYNKPANLNALALSESQVLLTWEDKVTGEDGFVIEVSIDTEPYIELATVDKNEITYFHKGLGPNTILVYKMYAFDDEGQSDYSNSALCITQDSPVSEPDAPTNLQAVAISDTQIGLEWVDNSNNEDGFYIYRSTTLGGPYDYLETVPPNTTEYTSDELTPDTDYYYVVVAYNSFDDSSESNEATATTLATIAIPDAPTNLVAVSVSNMRIDLEWTDNSEDEEVFYIQISKTEGGPYTDIAKVKPNVTTYESTSLEPVTTYYYRVYAANSVGNSGYSNIAKATTQPTPGSAPKAPTNLQAKAVSDVQIKIAWTDNSLDEDGFNIEMALDNPDNPGSPGEFRWIAKVKPNTVGYLVSSLRPNTLFWFRVNAFNFYGPSNYSNSASARTLPYTGAVPASPTNLVAKAYSNTQIVLGWWDNSDNEDGFNIEISKDGTNYEWWAKVPPNTKEYLVNGLEPDFLYYFRVRAYNKYGFSIDPPDSSNEASAKTNTDPENPPAAPTNLQAKGVSDTQIDLKWTDNSDNEDAFYIEVSGDGFRFELYAKSPPNEPWFSMKGLKPNLTLYFRVLAINSEGKSGYSNIAKATTLPEPTGAPDAPTSLVAKAISQTQVYIGWTDNSDNEDGFNIEMAVVAGEPGDPPDGSLFRWIETVKPNTKEFIVEGLKPGYTFWFRVNAFNAEGESGYSNSAGAQIVEISGAPDAPTSLVAKAISHTQVWIGWTDNSDNEDGFNIEMAVDYDNTGVEPNPEEFKWIETVKPDTKEFIVEGLKPSITFWFRVNAFNAEGESGYSNSAGVRTPEEPTGAPAAPINLVASAKSDTVIYITWTDMSDNEEGFIIEWGPDGSRWYSLDKVPTDTSDYTVEGLKPESTYYFRMFAFNGQGESDYSNTDSATTLPEPTGAPADPDGLIATAKSDSVIVLQWNDNSGNEEVFFIEWGPDGERWEILDKVPADSTGYVVEGLKPLTTRYFRVYAANIQGDSNYSNPANATTFESPDSPPAAPSDLVATAVGELVITLVWTDNSTIEEGFILEWGDGERWETLDKLPADTVDYKIGGLKDGVTYYFRLFAYNRIGESSYSNVDSATAYNR
ncbi:MAG: fibronectin type III domain-containing protein [Spirochaetota bacterium]|nr:MAG: fibronectin type III domain-containing protein [Spirochaetota bacterium]